MRTKRQFGFWLIVILLMMALGNIGWAEDLKLGANDPPAQDKINTEVPAVPEDPAVAAVMSTKPTTPSECVKAAVILSDLKRPDLARGLLQKVIDAKLDGPALAKLAEEFTSALFIKLSAQTSLHPQSQQLSDAVMAARNAELQNPERIAALIQDLQEPVMEKRAAAFSGLMEARAPAVAAMIKVLADPALAPQHASIRSALAAMGRQVVEPLAEILRRGDPALQVQAIAILGGIKSTGKQLLLFKPYLSAASDPAVRAAAADALRISSGGLPSINQAVRLLLEEAKKYFDLRQTMPENVDGMVDLWKWDQSQRQFVIVRVPAADGARAMSARLASDAFSLAPQDPAVSSLYLAAMLEAAAYQKGLPQPLDANDQAVADARQLNAKALEMSVDYAMANGHPVAATVAAQILCQMPGAQTLLYQHAQPSPLAMALKYPDRRLRISAARTIVALKPQHPFAGSSYLLPTLEFFASTSGMRSVLLAGSNLEDMRKMVSGLSAAGLHAETAANGRDLVRLAVSSPDYELAFIDMGIDRPQINLLLQQLRHDDRSADLRVGLIAREGFSAWSAHIAETDPLAKAFARPHDDVSTAWQLEQLAAIRPQEFVGCLERAGQAVEAMNLLAEIGHASGQLYDIRQAQDAVLKATNVPALRPKAIEVLAVINSPEAQSKLIDMSGSDLQSLEIRQQALAAFRENMQANGILLTTEEIQKQYKLYNDNKGREPASQKIYGMILDCLEAQAKKPEGAR